MSDFNAASIKGNVKRQNFEVKIDLATSPVVGLRFAGQRSVPASRIRGEPGHRTFPPLNLHKARVRRNHGRLPSNGFIERAQSSVLVRSSSAKRASDKALAFLPGTCRLAGNARH